MAFHSLLRSSNVFWTRNSVVHLRLKDLRMGSDIAMVNVSELKTNRFLGKRVRIPLRSIPDSHFCPLTALRGLNGSLPNDYYRPLFSYISKTGILTPFTGGMFTACQRKTMAAAGYQTKLFSVYIPFAEAVRLLHQALALKVMPLRLKEIGGVLVTSAT